MAHRLVSATQIRSSICILVLSIFLIIFEVSQHVASFLGSSRIIAALLLVL